MTATPTSRTPYVPRYPLLAALLCLALWIVVLSLPMWKGEFLAGPLSDQYSAGYAIRTWGAEQWRATGHPPLWNPMLRSGVPVVAGFGDLFYPTAWARLVAPMVTVWNASFVAHYILAGFFLFLFLRMFSVSWLGSVIGGTAYQLSGVIVSYPSPGHDGKLFVTALFPLMLIALVLAIRKRRFEGYALLALATALGLLSPQYQTTQYALIAAGLFTLYLVFGEPEGLSVRQQWTAIGCAGLAVAIGFGVAAIQFYPFLHYIPFSARSGDSGYDWATSYAIPWSHVPEFFLAGFSGYSASGTYWGPNGIKFHSEYLGLAVLALAFLGFRGERRRLRMWLGGIGVLFLLVGLGSGTPFYHLWYSLVPYVSKTRAPGIALYVVSLVVACFAAFGVERLERGEGKTWPLAAGIGGGVVALLALVGTFGSVALSWAQTSQDQLQMPLVQSAQAAQGDIRFGAVASAVGLLLVAGLVWSFLSGRIPRAAFAWGLVLLVGGDLYRAGNRYWQWSRPDQQQAAPDAITQYLNKIPLPYRVLECGVYDRDALMVHNIPMVLGYHGFDLATYDALVGGSGMRCPENPNIRSLNLWNLLAVRYFITGDSSQLPPVLHRVAGPVRTGLGSTGYLYEMTAPPPYARLVRYGTKVDANAIVPTLIDPRMNYDKIVLFDSGAAVNPLPLPPATSILELPSSAARATVTAWAPGKMSIALAPPPDTSSYLLVSENWYKDWHATVDDRPAPVVRGDESLITVVVPAGAKKVDLAFTPADYQTGKDVTLFSVVLLILMGAVPLVRRRMARG